MLFSDGIHNAAGDPVATARKLGLVVDTVGVGNSLRNSPSYRDVRVAGLECPEQLPVNNRARITAHVGQSGLAGQVVKAVLEEDGKAARPGRGRPARRRRAPGGLVPVRAHGQGAAHLHGPRSAGPRREDRSRTTSGRPWSQVVDSRIRVLYIEGTLRAEYGALVQRFLSKDPDLEFCALVQTRPNVFVQRTNMRA